MKTPGDWLLIPGVFCESADLKTKEGVKVLTQTFEQVVRQFGGFEPSDTVVVAVSTGVDSMVLLTLLQQLPAAHRPKLIVAHVDHQLRQQSRTERQFITAYCEQHGIPLKVATWPIADHPATGIEAAARDFRYTFFEQVMKTTQAATLVTAHHANDQAETILMKLIRGGELAQLIGIKPAQPFGPGRLVRPLLRFSKADLLAYAQHQHLTWYEDETNQTDAVLRNRIRHQILPDLQRENPAVLAHIQSYADQLQQSLVVERERVAQLLDQVLIDSTTGRLAVFLTLTNDQQLALLTAWFKQQRLTVTAAYVEMAQQLLLNPVKPQGELDFQGHVKLIKRYQTFSLLEATKLTENPQSERRSVLIFNQWVQFTPQMALKLSQRCFDSEQSATEMALALRPDDLPLTVRRAQPHDRIRLSSGGHKTIRRILIDRKLTDEQRQDQWVVTTAVGEVLWLVGIQRSARPTSLGERSYELLLRYS